MSGVSICKERSCTWCCAYEGVWCSPTVVVSDASANRAAGQTCWNCRTLDSCICCEILVMVVLAGDFRGADC